MYGLGRSAEDDCVDLDPVTMHFESVADSYDEVIPFFASFAARVAVAVDLSPDIRVLDVGTGRGALAAQAAIRGCRVTAVDSAPRMVALVRRDLPDVEAYVMTAQRLLFPDDSFDLVVAGFVLHIVDQPKRVMAEISRVLSSGGRLAFTTPGRADGEPDDRDELLDLVASYRRYQADGSGRHGNDADESDLLKEACFTDLTATTLEVALQVPDGETYWRWMNSHGAGTFAQRLPDRLRTELHDRICEIVDSHAGWLVRRSATIWQGVNP
jgi:ubiquinone/menaquinone biosynthesis C-methylase UbiE